jgi:4-amino-4-deoxy-L-arabinose transferase-like glycosyltransferase
MAWSRAAVASVLGAITVVDVALRFGAFEKVQPNPFYDAAVRSMSMSWHNFFFGAFEPSAQVSIDKAPADLWLQVASVKLFGFNSVALRLPEALGGALAVLVLYDLVRRLFGRAAGLGAALALAVLPASVMTARSDTMDSVMMALLVAAAWLIVVGAQSRRRWLIVAAGAVVGLAFNVKLFEALVALPALACLAFLLMDGPVRRRVVTLAASGAAMVAVSLSWVVTASLTPLSGRPWPIGSTNGSIWEVVFGYNGVSRLGHGSPGAAAVDPVGLTRLFGPRYGPFIGASLAAALALGALALAVGVAGRLRSRGAGDPDRARARVAGTAFIGVWLLSGLVFFSEMQRLRARYLEAMTPAVAAAIGAGAAVLVAAALRRRRPAVALGAAWLVAGVLVAATVVPFAGSLRIMQSGRTDAGHLGAMPSAQLNALSRFLRTHQGNARYETASTSSTDAGALIVRDGRPVLMLTSWMGQPLLTSAQLAHLVSTGQVRYLLSPPSGSPHSAPVLRWAAHHGHDVSHAAGLSHGVVLWELTAGRAQGRV